MPELDDGDRIDFARVIIDASVVERDGYKIYCLGPNVGRISFEAQQTRAINLVWALNRKEVIKQNQKVAVIGGGVSGITAACALIGYGLQVDLFEKENDILTRQAGATHRRVYPMINSWPCEDLTPTTKIPFLCWHADNCNNVVARIRDDFNRLRKETPNNLQLLKEFVKEFSSPMANDGKITLTTFNNKSFDGYDQVIVAAGFGPERDLEVFKPRTNEYWDPDNIETERDRNVSPSRFIVSGAGDGGLIDALRLAYNFRYGVFSFEIAKKAPDSVERVIRYLETRMKEDGDPEHSIENYLDLVKWMRDSHDACIKEFYNFISNDLNYVTNLVTICDNKISSIDESQAAPIHKFLIAFAVFNGTVKFLPNAIVLEEDDDNFAIGGDVFDPIDDYRFIVRRGADPIPAKCLTNAEWELLENKQIATREISYRRHWTELPMPPGFACPRTELSRFIQEMCQHARSAMHQINVVCEISPMDDHYLIRDYDGSYLPKSLFGVEVKNYEVEAASVFSS